MEEDHEEREVGKKEEVVEESGCSRRLTIWQVGSLGRLPIVVGGRAGVPVSFNYSHNSIVPSSRSTESTELRIGCF